MTHKDFSTKKKLFMIADGGADTGFASVSHNLIENLYQQWDIHILAINYQGDPHPIQQKAKMYNPAAKVQGDYYGTARVGPLLQQIKPDIVFLINDPWVGSSYQPLLKDYKGPIVLYTPIDAYNIAEDFVEPLNEFAYVVGYTQFGVDRLREAGLTIPACVIPHGVNKKLWKPLDRADAREKQGFGQDWFIVNITDRNQIRKRIDLGFYYFSEWVKQTNKPDNVRIHYHGGMEDEGWNLYQLAKAFGIKDRLIISAPNITAHQGIPLELMPYFYAPADVGLSTTMGEGWGLTTHERMAMRIPMIVPEYSALGEWARGGVHYTSISDIPYFSIRGLNTRGGIPEKQSTIDALEKMYQDKNYREEIAQKGYEIATQQKYSWSVIARQFNHVFLEAIRSVKTKDIKEDGTE